MKRSSSRRISRRRTLQGLGATVGLTAAGACGDDLPDPSSTTSGSGSGSGGTTGDGSSSGSSESSGALVDESSSEGGESSTGEPPAFGEDCAERSNLSPEELLAPIDTIVVLMMENRSFDHFFGSLRLTERLPVDGLTGRESNNDARGVAYPVFRSEYYVVESDPPHGWEASHAQWNRGANDGFVTQHVLEGGLIPEVVMGYHERDQLPALYTLGTSFTLCERWFASVMGPTQPNRFHIHLASSAGWQTNPEPGQFPSGLPNVFGAMTDAGHTSRYYFSNLPVVLAYGGPVDLVTPISQFFTDAENGTLPNFCIVDPMLTALDTIGNDDHPPADVRVGQAFIATIYQALAQSPQWNRCLLVITYDEHGGFYDHVSPPTTFDDEFPEFQQLGFRVPSVLVGPHVRRGCALDTQFDHVSVASTLTRRFGAAPLRKRVTMTNDLSSAIDPRYIDDPQPPIELPPVRMPMPETFTRLGSGAQHQIELVRAVERAGFRYDRAGHDGMMRWLIERGQALGAIEIV